MSTICCGRSWPKCGTKVEETDAQSVAPIIEPPLGMFNGRIDDKGRLKLPVLFAEYLASLPDKRLFVTSMDRRTAQIYPIATWRANQKLLNEQRENRAAAKRLLFTANDLGGDSELKDQGRVTFNPELRRKLDLDSQGLRLYWEAGHIQVLPDSVYAELLQETQPTTKQDLETLEESGLQ